MIKRKSDSGRPHAPRDHGGNSLAEVLRKKYQDIQDEEIPDRLQRLIDALKEAERREKEGD